MVSAPPSTKLPYIYVVRDFRYSLSLYSFSLPTIPVSHQLFGTLKAVSFLPFYLYQMFGTNHSVVPPSFFGTFPTPLLEWFSPSLYDFASLLPNQWLQGGFALFSWLKCALLAIPLEKHFQLESMGGFPFKLLVLPIRKRFGLPSENH